MKRLFAIVATVVMSGLLAAGAQASGWDRPDPGCHRVAYQPPGWPTPIEVRVCP